MGRGEEEKQEAEDSEGISHLKVPEGPRGGSHLLCGAPGFPLPPRKERKLASAPGPSPPPVPTYTWQGGVKARIKDEPREPGPRRDLPAQTVSLATVAEVAGAAAAAPRWRWRRVQAAQPGRRQRRWRRAAGCGAAS